MNNGIFLNIPDKDYFALRRESKHSLDEFLANPYAYFARKEANFSLHEESEVFALGRAIHCAVLEPERFARSYIEQPAEIATRRGKAWDAFKAENEGREILRPGESALVRSIADTVFRHPQAMKLLSACPLREVSMLWEDNGVKMKGRADLISSNHVIVGDFKTTSDASPEAFVKDCENYGYDLQAALYIDALRALGKDPKSFVFLLVEKTFPFTCALYTFDADSEFIECGRVENKRRLQAYIEFKRMPAGERKLGWQEHNLTLPPWSKRAKAYKASLDEAATKAFLNN